METHHYDTEVSGSTPWEESECIGIVPRFLAVCMVCSDSIRHGKSEDVKIAPEIGFVCEASEVRKLRVKYLVE